MILIGIAGGKRVGKSTLGQHLARRHRLLHTSFAEPIRAFVAGLLGGTLDDLEREKESPIAWLGGVTPRQMMQTLGTEWGRQMVHPDLWLLTALRRAYAAHGAVLSDVRFPNEAAAIRERGGFILRVDRPGFEPGADAHASERPLSMDLIDAVVVNNGSVEDLVLSAEGVLAGFGMIAKAHDMFEQGIPACMAVAGSD
ncbi:hypothetical protein MBSD_n2124 [Mizugakiibacter sediminis]|uniref:Deoxynucleotide monophosphate kinase n=1 Tax=Mizugakiibacter sediminis TaxID=1475481 RepID=A0A0K8QPI9_9GAMM|nr:hypothetical protein [Mizugakiibacter sediminis]GAP66809.1 hypothetical protein MBSD_n2124 [Mizugakiibacter sediminis]